MGQRFGTSEQADDSDPSPPKGVNEFQTSLRRQVGSPDPDVAAGALDVAKVVLAQLAWTGPSAAGPQPG